MAQQPHDMSYLDYNAANNRSPSSSRQPYGAPAFNPGLSLPRQTQRPFDGPLGSSALYPSDRVGAGTYNPRAMDTMSGGAAMPGYMLDGNQTWNYGASGAATVNGAVNGPNRNRNSNRRTPLPQVRPL
jgi:hypothetical protein